MITITVSRKDKLIENLLVEGHSNSAPYGKDLVCAAVSAIITGGINAIEAIDNFDYKVSSGYAMISVKKPISIHDQDVLETMLIQLLTIEEANKKYVKVIKKGI